MYVATERGKSDNTEATRFSQCAHDLRRRLEAEDCDSILCAQLISGGRRRIRPPRCLAHARPTMCCIHLVGASVSEPHTYGVAGAEMRNIFIYNYYYDDDISIVRQRGPGGPNSSRAAAPAGQYHTRAVRACCGAGPRPTSRPTVVDVGRETRQPIRATSRDRLSSDSLEEMEARIMSHAARMLISRATVLPGACVCW